MSKYPIIIEILLVLPGEQRGVRSEHWLRQDIHRLGGEANAETARIRIRVQRTGMVVMNMDPRLRDCVILVVKANHAT